MAADCSHKAACHASPQWGPGALHRTTTRERFTSLSSPEVMQGGASLAPKTKAEIPHTNNPDKMYGSMWIYAAPMMPKKTKDQMLGGMSAAMVT